MGNLSDLAKHISQPKPGSKEAAVRALREAEEKAGNPAIPTFCQRKPTDQSELRLQMIRDADEQRRARMTVADDRKVPATTTRTSAPSTMPSTSPAQPKAGSVRAEPVKETTVNTTPQITPTSPTSSPKKPPAKKAAAPKKAKPAKAAKKAEGKTSKVEIVAGLLKRKNGCTRKDILSATGWPSVSVGQQATAAGLKLQKVKEGAIIRYYAK